VSNESPELRVDHGRLLFTWESQARQYPTHGKPGLSYYRGDVSEAFCPGAHVDCLLWRDDTGALIGILNHYPMDFPPYEKAGNVLVYVRADRRRAGIGTALVHEARTRWPVDFHAQRYTDAGAKLARSLLADGAHTGHDNPKPTGE
jgi:GNAT superfamily N-acetyltransferase